MRKFLVCVVCVMLQTNVFAQNKYDLNGDGFINGSDVVDLYNYIQYGSGNQEAREITVKNLGSSVTFKMITVEGGTFYMGATLEQSNPRVDEAPAHEVTLSSFLIGETEVTQELWQLVTGCRPTADSYQWDSKYGVGKEYPAYFINHNDCLAFIEKLNSLTGLKFRLPTEAEWEYAARGGKKSQHFQYSGSDNLDDVAWSDCYSKQKLQPVKSKNANELGIYDMSGNVGEWCSDIYGGYSSEAQTDPTGPKEGTEYVNRGGRWYFPPVAARNAYRTRYDGSMRYSNLGLRLVLQQ